MSDNGENIKAVKLSLGQIVRHPSIRTSIENMVTFSSMLNDRGCAILNYHFTRIVIQADQPDDGSTNCALLPYHFGQNFLYKVFSHFYIPVNWNATIGQEIEIPPDADPKDRRMVQQLNAFRNRPELVALRDSIISLRLPTRNAFIRHMKKVQPDDAPVIELPEGVSQLIGYIIKRWQANLKACLWPKLQAFLKDSIETYVEFDKFIGPQADNEQDGVSRSRLKKILLHKILTNQDQVGVVLTQYRLHKFLAEQSSS